MAKKAKKSQTDFTKGGRDISNTAVPLYQNTLRDISDYNANTQGYIDDYLNKYFTNTSEQNDFMRDYNRAMANKTAQNYSATGGGYSSAGQRAYEDLQRAENDLANRIYTGNVANATNMANQYYQNLLKSTDAYDRAYLQGKAYSDVQQYNDMVDQANSWTSVLGNAASGVGKVLSTIPNPWTQGIGAGLQILGEPLVVEMPQSAYGAGSGQGAGTGAQQGMFGNTFGNIATGLAAWSKSSNAPTWWNQSESNGDYKSTLFTKDQAEKFGLTYDASGNLVRKE